jgi:hypothetical protein
MRCHQQFGDQVPEPHQIWHSPRGWSIENLILDHLDWSREQFPTESICLILNQSGTHETDSFKLKAQRLGVFLVQVPKGATRTY